MVDTGHRDPSEAFSGTLAPDEEIRQTSYVWFRSFARAIKISIETIMHKTMDGVGCSQLGYCIICTH